MNFASIITDYVLNFNIRTTSLLDFKEITVSFRKLLMNAFNMFTFFSRFARFALFFLNLFQQTSTFFSRLAWFVALFFNLSRLFASEIIKKQAKKNLREALKFFIAKKDILSVQRIIVDDRSKAIIEISLSKKSRKALSSSLFFLFFTVIKLHADARKKIKRAFHAAVKFVFKESERNVNDCDYKKMNILILWKLNLKECKIDELFLILQELNQIQKNKKEKNVCRLHWRLIAWKLKLILMNNKDAELTRKILLIKLYYCFDHAKKFNDLKTRFNTKIWFRSEYRSVKFNNVSQTLKF